MIITDLGVVDLGSRGTGSVPVEYTLKKGTIF